MMNRSLAKYLDDLTDCVIIRKDEDKIIVKIPDDRNGTAALFVKIYIHKGLRSRLRNLLNGKTAGKRDHQVCVKLQEIGIQVPKPVGYCDNQTNLLSTGKSLFAAQWLDGKSLAALIHKKSRQTDFKGKAGAEKTDARLIEKNGFSTLCYQLGGFVATLHNKGVYSKDLNVGNVLIEIANTGLPDFFLLDYENVCFKKQVGRNKSLNNIIQVCAALMQVNETAYEDFCSGYAKARPQFNVLELKGYILEKAKRLQVLWKEKIDGNFERIAEALKTRNR
ncbi:uncharacterized protein Dvar_43200 [Desulfosarcina variabilis str. Montpellier]|uniref:lipopolysaccharide kinase InaA family protein n=1 Tax=Desulfosarcina variabilis TaxID=2300 RepID=UPI003AFA7799